jgi:hypothetical protein
VETTGMVLVVTMSVLALVVRIAVGFWYQPLGVRRTTMVLRYDIACGFGITLALTILYSNLVLDHIAVQQGLDVAQVVDSPMLDYPVMFIYGAGFGIIASMLGGYQFGAKPIVLLGLPFGVWIIYHLAAGSNPDVQQANVAATATAVLFRTHLIWQPLHLLVGILANTAARVDPSDTLTLWRISPASWSEFCYVPLPGLSGLVNALRSVDKQAGQQAIEWLCRPPFYSRVGKKLAKSVSMEQGRV